jgi:hypothetical protein
MQGAAGGSGGAGTEGKENENCGHGGVGTDQQNCGHGGVGTDQENRGHGGVGPQGPVGAQGRLMLIQGAGAQLTGHAPGSSHVRAVNRRNEFMAQTPSRGSREEGNCYPGTG